MHRWPTSLAQCIVMSSTLRPAKRTRRNNNTTGQIGPWTWTNINADIKSLNIMHNMMHKTSYKMHNSSIIQRKHTYTFQHSTYHHNSWKHAYIIIDHTQMQLSSIHNRSNIHSCKRPFIYRNYGCRSKMDESTYLFGEELASQPATLLQRSTQP